MLREVILRASHPLCQAPSAESDDGVGAPIVPEQIDVAPHVEIMR